MAELKLVISGDVQKANKALDDFVAHTDQAADAAQSAGAKINKALSKPLPNTLPASIDKANNALQKLPQSSNSATLALTNLGRVAQDAPFGFLGIANNLNPLLEGFQRLKAESGSTRGALKALGSSLVGAGGLGLAVSVASSLLIVFGDRIFKTSKQVEEAEDANKRYKESIEGIFQNAGKEASEVISLIAVLKSETETRERKLAAIKELQSIQPEVFNNLKLEGNAVAGLDSAYKEYLQNLRTVIAVKIKQAKLQQLITKQLELEGATLTQSEKTFKSAIEGFKEMQAEAFKGPSGVSALGLQLQKEKDKVKKEGADITRDIEALFKDITELSTGVEVKIETKDAKKEVEDFINRAKKLAEELEKIGFIAPAEFSFFDDLPTQLQKARKVFRDFADRNLKLNRDFFKIEPTFSEPTSRDVQEFLNTVEQGLQKGIIERGGIDISVNITTDFSRNAEVLRNFQEAFRNIGQALPEINLFDDAGFNENVLLDRLRKFFGAANNVTKEELFKMAAEWDKGFQNIENTIKGLKVDTVSGFAEAIGSALSGEGLQNIFEGFANLLSTGLQNIGKQLISIGIAAKAAKESLKNLFTNPFAAIAAGAALVALGGILKASIGKGVPGFAAGGVVSGATLAMVGEGFNTNSANPEIIAPLDKLKGLLADLGGSGSQRVIVSGRLRGQDMVLQTARTVRSQRRTRGR